MQFSSINQCRVCFVQIDDDKTSNLHYIVLLSETGFDSLHASHAVANRQHYNIHIRVCLMCFKHTDTCTDATI